MKLYFDILIILGIFITAFPAVVLLYSSIKRPDSLEYKFKFISRALAGVLACASLGIMWGSFIEPRILVIHEETIDIAEITQPISIVFMADFQVGPYKQTEWIEKVVNKTLALEPDIVLIGGDQVDNATYNLHELTFLQPLERLAAEVPTYAIHGNHEYGIGGGKSIDQERYRVGNMTAQTKEKMESLGIRYLINDLVTTTIHNQELYIFGGDEYWARKLDFDPLTDRTQEIPTIGLIHNPTFILGNHPADVDLWLSGHTHGGQIRLPFIGPLGKVDEILPKKFYKGLHKLGIDNNYLYVTSGAGETGTRARLFNPPEIALIILK